MFRDAGLAPKIRQGAFGTLLSLVQAGQADIALELEPNISQAARGGAHVLYSMKDVYGPFAITGLTATPATVEGDPALVKDVTCALQKSLDYIRRDRAGALQLLLRRFSDLDQKVAMSALDRVLKEGILPETLETSPEAWAKATQLRVDIGDLSKDQNLKPYIDNGFAQSATASQECRDR
jgi:NitT/TauT family transport system substrate-binding protein